MLILNASDVRESLPMTDAIAGMKRAFAALVEGRAKVPVRTQLPIDKHAGVTLVMPALIEGDDSALVVKVASVFNRNLERGLARIQAAVLVFDPETGRPTACLEGATLTGIRTAAAAGAATDLLARAESRGVAILGAGVLARTHLEAVCNVRRIETAWIYGPTPANVASLIAELAGRGPIPADLRAATSPAEALAEADIVCAATNSATPVFADGDLKPGAHVNAVGSYQPHTREIPAETIRRAAVFVDDRAAAWEEAGDLILPLNAGEITRDHIVAGLGELVLDRVQGRQRADEITVFKSVGVAVQDAVAAQIAVQNAIANGVGQVVEF